MRLKGKNKAVLSAGQIYFYGEEGNRRTGVKSFQGGDPVPVQSQPEDFERIAYRQISATVVGSGSWKATDFSNPDVLRQAIPMFKGKTVYKNHDMYVGNHVGVIGDAVWQEQTTDSQGRAIPAGINAPFIIDKVLHPRLVRELTSEFPPVKSVSITVEFEWEASHDFEDMWDFIEHLGEMVEGREVTRVVTQILTIAESSLVWEGADPFAKKIGEDGRVMLEKDGFMQSFKKQGKTGDVKENKKTDDMDKKILAFFNAETPEDVLAKIDGLVVLTKEESEKPFSDIETLKADIATQKTAKEDALSKITELEKTVSEQAAFVKHGKDAFDAALTEAKRLYNAQLPDGQNPSDAMLKDLEQSSFEALKEKVMLFGGKLENTFTRTCNDCGSTSVSLKSSKQNDASKTEEVDTEDVEVKY